MKKFYPADEQSRQRGKFFTVMVYVLIAGILPSCLLLVRKVRTVGILHLVEEALWDRTQIVLCRIKCVHILIELHGTGLKSLCA